MKELSLGFSPCPNDTFIFYALVHGRVQCPGINFVERLEDVETLNSLALQGHLDVSKVSFHALAFLRDQYMLLRTGSALGRGCGPLLVSRKLEDISSLKGKTIAIPGRYTTAALLLRLFDPSLERIVCIPFDKIMGAIASGEVDAGVIIHESRFTYPSYGLNKIVDLGEWWEKETGNPIPLGGIVARRGLGDGAMLAIEKAIGESLRYSMEHPGNARGYIAQHAQELSEETCAAHIDLYVNNYSRMLGEEGEKAVQVLMARAEEAGIVPKSAFKLFPG